MVGMEGVEPPSNCLKGSGFTIKLHTQEMVGNEGIEPPPDGPKPTVLAIIPIPQMGCRTGIEPAYTGSQPVLCSNRVTANGGRAPQS